MIHIMKSSDEEFKPHIALCHMEYNGGSANKENVSLVMKAKHSGDKLNTVLKSLGMDASVLKKASYQNLKEQLQAALREDNGDNYVYVEDFDPEKGTVVYESYVDDNYSLYSRGFSIGDGDIVSVESKSEEIKVVGHKVYTTVEEGDLLLKGNDELSDTNSPSGVNNEGNTSDEKEEENEMSEVSVAEQIEKALAKQAEGHAEMIQKALDKQAADIAEVKLVEDTTEVMKSFGFVEEADLSVVVKALVGTGEAASVIMKAFGAAQEKIVAEQAKVEKIQKEFADKEPETEESLVEDQELSFEERIAQNVEIIKASKAK